MERLEILIGREHIDPRLPMGADPSLARVMGHMNFCTCIAGMQGGKNVAVCLLNEQYAPDVCDIPNLSFADEFADHNFFNDFLAGVMDYARTKGFRFLEIGIGNAKLDSHKALQKMGFRVIGVVLDYYQSDAQSLAVEDGIVNRDLIRYRVDFKDGWSTWTREVKQYYEK